MDTMLDDTSARDSKTQKNGAGSSRKVLRALLAFSISHPRHSAESLAAKLRLPISSTYRYLAILREANLIVDDGRGFFVLSSRVAELAQVAHGSSSLALQARPHLKRLVKSLNQTSILVKLNNDLAVCVASERAAARTRFIFDVGVAMPLFQGAGPKLLLAHLRTDEQLAVIMRLKEKDAGCKIEPEDLLKQLADIRSQGWAQSDSEIQPDVLALAVGVYDDNGDLIAALSAIRHVRQTSAPDKGTTLALLQTTAKNISQAYAESLR